MKNRPNTETKLIVFSVHCLSLPIYIQKMVQEELSRVGSKMGVGSSGQVLFLLYAKIISVILRRG